MALTEKDRIILAELDRNARSPDSEIAKKARLNKQVVNYRIKNLIKQGIINNFYTVINVGKIGFNSHYVFLQLESVNEKEEKALLEKIKNKPYIGWLVSGTGKWDAVLLVYARSSSEFDNHLNDILATCNNHIHEYAFANLITAEHFGYKFLGQKNSKSISQTEKTTSTKLDETDKTILKTISQNARLSIVNLSEKIKVPIHTIRYRLKELTKKQIIESFKPKIEINKLGYQWHLLLIQFSAANEKRRKEFVEFCSSNKKVYYATQTIGNYNLMLDLHVHSTEDFKKTLFELKEKFSDVIKNYDSMIIFDEYKIDYFTELFS
ncbi:MAG: Lrp/AsnC family transcriptional regulator [Nanoarchaeota archaeon]|nr:Lrp/AsnC family transcriptional regulator [Nanoarchaeota archaeon]